MSDIDQYENGVESQIRFEEQHDADKMEEQRPADRGLVESQPDDQWLEREDWDDN